MSTDIDLIKKETRLGNLIKIELNRLLYNSKRFVIFFILLLRRSVMRLPKLREKILSFMQT